MRRRAEPPVGNPSRDDAEPSIGREVSTSPDSSRNFQEASESPG